MIKAGKVRMKLTVQDVAECPQFMAIWYAASLGKEQYLDVPGGAVGPLDATVNGEPVVYGNSVERIDIPEGILKGRKSWGRTINKENAHE